MRMNIPALVTLLCPFFPSACEPTDNEPVEAAHVVIADEPRRVRMGETMGSTSGESTTSDTGMMPVEDTDGEFVSTGGGSSTSGTTSEPEDCPWWGCDGLPGTENGCQYWDCEPGEKWWWLNIMTDCAYPKGHPEIGDAMCPSPKKCLTPEDFGPYWTTPYYEALLAALPLVPAICALPAPPDIEPDPCWQLDSYLTGYPDDPNFWYGGVVRTFPTNLPGESYCMFTDGYEGLLPGSARFDFLDIGILYFYDAFDCPPEGGTPGCDIPELPPY